MNSHSICRVEDDGLRRDHAGSRKSSWDGLRREVLNISRVADNGRTYGNARVGTQDSNRAIVAGDNRSGFNASAAGQLLRAATCNGNLPDVTAIDITLIGRVTTSAVCEP